MRIINYKDSHSVLFKSRKPVKIDTYYISWFDVYFHSNGSVDLWVSFEFLTVLFIDLLSLIMTIVIGSGLDKSWLLFIADLAIRKMAGP